LEAFEADLSIMKLVAFRFVLLTTLRESAKPKRLTRNDLYSQASAFLHVYIIFRESHAVEDEGHVTRRAKGRAEPYCLIDCPQCIGDTIHDALGFGIKEFQT